MSTKTDIQPTFAMQLDIIAADDARAQRRLLQTILSYAGHRIRIAVNGKDAFRLAGQSPPDLLITDLEMPGGGGLGLIDAIRNAEDARLRQIPIIVCSSQDGHESLNEVFNHGATSFVTKPLHLSELQMAIQNLPAA